MALMKKPVTGMKDILPQEMQIRDYLIGLIKETYRSFGFTPIETPVVENLSNLTSKQGGDNEKLIFKVMKRGEKFNLATATCEEDLSDSGLRYDLTVPLVRYYSNNANDLPKPFKALQIGPVFRADRPQKGRFRQFYQCDIDILGEAGPLGEIEVILATTTWVGKGGFKNFTGHINDRRILKAMAAYSGFAEDTYDRAFIILDKMDKIGRDGVAQELREAGYDSMAVDKYMGLFEAMEKAENSLNYLQKELDGFIEEGVLANLQTIIAGVTTTTTTPFHLHFNPTLVRGMSYYTGPIFEIEIAGLGCSAGGGGRYDEMVGKFTNMQVPATGFSIGFERIVTILLDQGFQVPGAAQKKAYLLEKNMPENRLCEILKEAQIEREAGIPVLIAMMNKNKKFQKEQLTAEGYTEFKEFYINQLD